MHSAVQSSSEKQLSPTGQSEAEVHVGGVVICALAGPAMAIKARRKSLEEILSMLNVNPAFAEKWKSKGEVERRRKCFDWSKYHWAKMAGESHGSKAGEESGWGKSVF
jgi:uncharacterized protein YbdZ (MbtH family)